MIIFIKLLLAHLLGDFLFQPTKWVLDKESKKQKSIYLYFHIVLHGVLVWILVGQIAFGWWAFVIAITHGCIDFLKLKFQKNNTKRSWFIVDQLLHISVLIAVTLLYNNQKIDFSIFDNEFWLLLTAILFLTKPASIIIKNIISIWTPDDKTISESSLANAGNYIGILERLFIFCFIITDHFNAIGFLLAAKSIFRFGDLREARDRKLTEYVLIGTLISFGIAILTGILVQVGLLQAL